MKVFLLLCLLPVLYCLNNGLALTPAMGWNSWNKFSCNINETLIQETADAMVSSGLAAVGYQFVNVDDCWSSTRNATTNQIIANPATFPSGIPALADYVHSKGLKFGIYSDAGNYTCQGKPGSLGYEEVDAQTFADWGVDYLKYDNCNNDNIDPQIRYPKMKDALNATGKPIYYSICEWQNEPWTWAPPVGNSWRNHDDIQDNWSDIMNILNLQVSIASIGAPGQWNDPDMLEVGNGGMTTTEYESHFALWAFLKSPLIIGCDVRNMSNDTFRILSSKEIIAVNQDKLGKPAEQLYSQHEQQIWGGPVEDGFAALLLNTDDNNNSTFNVQFQLFNITGKAFVRDLYAERTLGVYSDFFSVNVTSHGVFAMKLTPVTEEYGFLPDYSDIIS